VALSWNLSKIDNKDSICWIEAPEDIPGHGVKAGEMVMNPITNALIWATISVDLPGITRENAAEFYARLRITECIFGAFLIRAEDENGKRPEGEAAFITMNEVIDHIGLTCNVSPTSRTKWLKRISSEMDAYARAATKRIEDPVAA
jgi:hypothetical protein